MNGLTKSPVNSSFRIDTLDGPLEDRMWLHFNAVRVAIAMRVSHIDSQIRVLWIKFSKSVPRDERIIIEDVAIAVRQFANIVCRHEAF